MYDDLLRKKAKQHSVNLVLFCTVTVDVNAAILLALAGSSTVERQRRSRLMQEVQFDVTVYLRQSSSLVVL